MVQGRIGAPKTSSQTLFENLVDAYTRSGSSHNPVDYEGQKSLAFLADSYAKRDRLDEGKHLVDEIRLQKSDFGVNQKIFEALDEAVRDTANKNPRFQKFGVAWMTTAKLRNGLMRLGKTISFNGVGDDLVPLWFQRRRASTSFRRD